MIVQNAFKSMIGALAITLAASACSSPERGILGAWTSSNERWEFFKDGTGYLEAKDSRVVCRWSSVEGDRIKIEITVAGLLGGSTERVFLATVARDELTLDIGGGDSVTYLREGSPKHILVVKNQEADKAYRNGIDAMQRGDEVSAIAEFEKCIPIYEEIGTPSALSSNALAWIYATSKDPSLQNGPRAVELALSATEQDPNEKFFWGTLAAAYARNSRFAEAIEAQQKAITVGGMGIQVDELERQGWYREFQGRLELYRQGKPAND